MVTDFEKTSERDSAQGREGQGGSMEGSLSGGDMVPLLVIVIKTIYIVMSLLLYHVSFPYW